MPSRLVARLPRTLIALLLTLSPVGSDASATTPDALGDVSAYRPEHAKALDPVYDTEIAGETRGDLMSVYFADADGRIAIRVGLKDLGRDDFVADGTVAISVLLDYAADGSRDVPGATAGDVRTTDPWDLAVSVSSETTVRLASPGRSTDELLRRARITPEADMVEVSLNRPAGWTPGDAVGITVLSLVGGKIQDRIVTNGQARAGAHNAAFVQHGNQGLTWTTVFRGERGENAASDGDVNNPDDGFDEILALHDFYDIPGCFHLAGQLQTSAEWHDPSFNDWLATGVSQGWADMITSAYAQHIMPFVQNDMNDWAVNVEKQMTDFRYGSNVNTAWVPERVWVSSPDTDGNGVDASCGVVDGTLTDNWMQHGVQAVILDDVWHLVQYDGAFEDRHIYVDGAGLKYVPIDNTFVGDVNWNWGNAWNTIINLSSDELAVYGNDWEFVAEVSQGASNPNALNNYAEVIRQASLNSATVSVWKLSDAINEPSFLQNMDGRPVENATYGLLGAHGGYGGGCNSWYVDWASYSDPQHAWDQHVPRWDYGTVWNNTFNKIVGTGVNNDLTESAWYVMMTNLHETGWHDTGEISGWIHRYSNHVKNANVYAEAARWADGLYASTNGAYLEDIDRDGQDEAVIHNDRVMAVFEPIGGLAAQVFAKGPGHGYSVVGNCNVFWAETEGDYNETNHVGALSDVSVAGVDREFDLYSLQVVQGTGTTVQLQLVHPNVTKTVTLTQGDKYLDVVYDASGQDVYMKSGMSPDLIDLIWNAQLDRVWSPAPSGAYFGQRNPNTGATAAIVVGSGGATHNLQLSSTLMEVDELFGSGKFQLYLFAGETAPPGGGGEIAELDALAAGLVDALPPAAVSALYFPGADKLTIVFDEDVRFDEIVLTGISVDDDDDGTADVTLSGASTVLTPADGSRIDIALDAPTAAALEALSTGSLELMLTAAAVKDAAGNGNAALDHTGDVAIQYQPETLITIDGFLDPAEWTASTCIVDDYWDSGWTTTAPSDTNDINALYTTWDDTYLYLGVRGIVYGNSWILYLDVDESGPNGEADLTAIDTWERGTSFTGGFLADFQYGAFQHQGGFDSDSFWKIESDTTTTDLSGSIVHAFDPSHAFYADGGSELAIPWDVLYGLGPGNVPVGARMCLVASICWDPEPSAELGGDSAPDNSAAALPEIDGWISFSIDSNGDGLPDDPPIGVDAPAVEPRVPDRALITGVAPNPFRPETRIAFSVPDRGAGAERARLAVYDVTGREVAVLVNGKLPPGAHEARWTGIDATGRRVASGVYFARLTAAAGESVRKVILLN